MNKALTCGPCWLTAELDATDDGVEGALLTTLDFEGLTGSGGGGIAWALQEMSSGLL